MLISLLVFIFFFIAIFSHPHTRMGFVFYTNFNHNEGYQHGALFLNNEFRMKESKRHLKLKS